MDRLPASLQLCILLEWISPEQVWILVRLSGALRRCVLTAPQSFSAGENILSDACVHWFQDHRIPLRLYVQVTKDKLYGTWHLRNGKIHRDGDLPARIWPSGMQDWWQNGKRHRMDGPAVVSFGTRMWYKHDQQHRDGDLPAVIWADGKMEWYRHGKLHRGDGPAIITHNGSKHWYRHDKLHRDEDRPAAVWADGKMEWYRHGKLHRGDDKPAVVWPNGTREWYQNGVFQRIDLVR